jgi:hypothetical protein
MEKSKKKAQIPFLGDPWPTAAQILICDPD